MAVAVKIITPVRCDRADLSRRTTRYAMAAGPEARIEVFDIPGGPQRLASAADLAASDAAAFEVGRHTRPEDFDAILFDCVFDAGLGPLRAAVAMPVFGPLSFTLAALPQMAKRYSMIVRTDAHRELLLASQPHGGADSSLQRIELLGLTDDASRDPVSYDAAMVPLVARLAAEDPRQAVILGSTTMDITPAIRAAAGRMPLLHPSLFTLDAIRSLARNAALPPRP